MIKILCILLLASIAGATTIEVPAVVTAYTPSIEGGGAGTGKTAIGVKTDETPYGIAADPRRIPYGAVVKIPGYREEPEKGGPWWQVDDTGAAMRQDGDRGVVHIDLRMKNPWAARRWGVRTLIITIYIPDEETP
jgi:3D (Asp-Asp-Asp) domain-containing protein